jgi:ribosomal protein S18 acetylase RimI-like enzyme
VSIRLRPLREDEFPGWEEHHRAWYAADLATNGGLSEQAARRKAERDTAALFPQGFASPNNELFVVELAGVAVGSVWFAPRDEGGESTAFLYAVEIDVKRRGEGLGREAMRLFEEEARQRGFKRVRLNVFGGNERARHLYRSLGYSELSLHMGKEL